MLGSFSKWNQNRCSYAIFLQVPNQKNELFIRPTLDRSWTLNFPPTFASLLRDVSGISASKDKSDSKSLTFLVPPSVAFWPLIVFHCFQINSFYILFSFLVVMERIDLKLAWLFGKGGISVLCFICLFKITILLRNWLEIWIWHSGDSSELGI